MPDETPPDHPWQQSAPPDGRLRWTWHPTGLEDLPRVRRELRVAMSAVSDRGGPPESDLAEDIVMALDELMSNALRHGRAPVSVEVHGTADGVLLLVSDRASDRPPRPTATRDRALGGMGLGIVATTSTASGWFARADVKVVWAVLPERVPHAR